MASASEIARDMHERIFELLEQNMKALYDETSSWDPWLKRDELLHPKSRFLLAFEDHENSLTSKALLSVDLAGSVKNHRPSIRCKGL